MALPSYAISLKYSFSPKWTIVPGQQQHHWDLYCCIIYILRSGLCTHPREMGVFSLQQYYLLYALVCEIFLFKNCPEGQRICLLQSFILNIFWAIYMVDSLCMVIFSWSFRPWADLKEKLFNPSVKLDRGEHLWAVLNWITVTWRGSLLLINAIFNWNLNLSL